MLADAPAGLPTGWTEQGLVPGPRTVELWVSGNAPGDRSVLGSLADGVAAATGAAADDPARQARAAWLIARAAGDASAVPAPYAAEIGAVLTRPAAEQWAWYLVGAGP